MAEPTERTVEPPEIADLARVERQYGNRLAAKLATLELLREIKRERAKRAYRAYRLERTPDAFARIAKAYLGSPPAGADEEKLRLGLDFLATSYARACLTPDFARAELSKRQIVMPRMVYLGSDGREFDPSPDDERTTLHADLPVCPSERQREATARRAIEDLEWWPTPKHHAGLVDWIQRHYAEYEDTRLVFPMLALCQISPSALRIFLSDWATNPDPVAKGWNMDGTRRVEHVLFDMIYAAISDLIAARSIPKGMDATWAVVSPDPVPARADFPPALLEIQWRQQGTIGLRAGFVAQEPFTRSSVTTWWRPRAVMGPVPPFQLLESP